MINNMKNKRKSLFKESISKSAMIHRSLMLLICFYVLSNLYGQEYRAITEKELRSKIEGFWLGQLVGNYMGFPFEFVFSDEPSPIFIDRYYNATDSVSLKMNHTDRRGNVNIFADALGGAWSDDDTDIEFVTLHAA